MKDFVARGKQSYQYCNSNNSAYFLPLWGWCWVLQNVPKGCLFKVTNVSGLITLKGNLIQLCWTYLDDCTTG